MGKTNRNNDEHGKKGHGVVHPMNMGNVGAATTASEAGRERKRHEREVAESAREARRAQEDTKRKVEQITDPIELAAACDAILAGKEGVYHVLGIEAEVRMYQPPMEGAAPYPVFEFIDALWVTGLMKFIKQREDGKPGIFIPVSLLKKNPEKTEYKGKFGKEWEVLCKYMHAVGPFSRIAATLRKQEFAERQAEAEKEKQKLAAKERQEFLASLKHAKNVQPDLDVVRDLGPKLMTAKRGLWQLDGATLKTWTHKDPATQKSTLYIKVSEAPEGNEFAKFVGAIPWDKEQVEVIHLINPEKPWPVAGYGAVRRELRELLRTKLRALGILPAAPVAEEVHSQDEQLQATA